MIQIAIIGLGMIGTSLGMALRSANPKESLLGEVEIVGFDQNNRAIKDARGRLAIDREARSIAEVVRNAQIVIVATPVQAIRDIFTQLATLLPAGVIVTDTASAKAQVCAWAHELLPTTTHFVGGHPMAGKEQSGALAADPDLFKEAIYCLTPDPRAHKDSVDVIDAMVNAIGAKSYYIDPDEHDAYVAGVSHLPFLLSAALVAATSRSPAWKEMAPLAATGFHDVSRLASGDPTMHRDICITNHVALTRWINETITLLVDLREHLAQHDSAALEQFFQHAKEKRDEWLKIKPNQRPGEDVFSNIHTVERPNLFGFRRPQPDRKRRP
ncbi:MAG: prephenate dehydrogenase/arogenate dehydrogenase family protein [Chloroflexales bacterium]|nr:prephenate dehydrogenase/arogenate dehydrogenase family protein [Chloroflexales bacterium]